MPKRTDIEKILIIGAGPIVIGQACEFDYSGAQACKALREEGYHVILVNSNPATIMTDPEMADATYIEPIRWQTVAEIIKDERPDAILPTMGGQTALNCALDLHEHGVLEAYGVQLLGASIDAINTAEDRDLFKQAMNEIGLGSARSGVAHSLTEALEIQKTLGYPTVIRPSFTLGGAGGGIAYNHDEFIKIVEHGLELSPSTEVLLEESLLGWKEYEMEVVRDKADNAIIVCSIENFDPMGVHTGDSITIAPAQTLTDKEYQVMRNASIAILRKIGVETGGSNVQFSVNPDDGRLIVIEMNPRVSRSSALASKATGFPIAKIAAKLAVGFTLDELKNEITGGQTPASFEPSIDYVVTKIPRFNFEKFPQTSNRLTTQMKSVGEVMAIGRTIVESMQKALRSMETGISGLDKPTERLTGDALRNELGNPSPMRLFYIADALRQGYHIDQLYQITAIDPWFLTHLQHIVSMEKPVSQGGIDYLDDADLLFDYKRNGFSDIFLAKLCGEKENAIRKLRQRHGVHPVYKRVDSCAAEFSSSTAYMYSTYEEECEAKPDDKPKIMILGGGPNRIGQGIEFDYCCVHASMALREVGYETIMVNCNPETVSTDYDTSDRLYFEPLTLEDVLEIVRVERPKGVIVQYGGQTPLKLADDLAVAGVPIIGTPPDSIDLAEDRERFQQLLAKLDLKQPPNRIANSIEEAVSGANDIGYPLVVRPSYVLGGRAMEIVYDEENLIRYMNHAIESEASLPILLDRFLNDAIEVDVDAVCDGHEVVIGGIMEHIEEAGVHSGDSACSLPPYSLSAQIQEKLSRQVVAMAKEIGVIGLMNTQFAVKDSEIYVLEVNPRASRTIPYVSKSVGKPLAKIAARLMAGSTLAEEGLTAAIRMPDYFSIKEAVFPFAKFPGVDPLLGPEMKSTGEVMGVGSSFAKAFARALLGAGEHLPAAGDTVFISVKDEDKQKAVEIANTLTHLDYNIIATHGTFAALQSQGIACQRINKLAEGRPNVVDAIKNGEVTFVINTTQGQQAIIDSFEIRRESIMGRVLYATTMSGAKAIVTALSVEDLNKVKKLQVLHSMQ
ncbi:MAG: carbamoyl phosphate synthase large subunit [Gammaproteobacteria bacterium]|nr:MAG: carbamoyl phosphate synthase large subunit [Gammaproteobacteria bacterium]